MKLPLLNDLLNNQSSYSAVFLYPPVALPTDQAGRLVVASQATNTLFSTIVFVKELNELAVFEFNQPILDGILGYRERYGNTFRFEVLLSRHDDSKIKMTIGRNNLVNELEFQKMADNNAELINKLYEVYLRNPEHICKV